MPQEDMLGLRGGDSPSQTVNPRLPMHAGALQPSLSFSFLNNAFAVFLVARVKSFQRSNNRFGCWAAKLA